jgi:hypothetical protein
MLLVVKSFGRNPLTIYETGFVTLTYRPFSSLMGGYAAMTNYKGE